MEIFRIQIEPFNIAIGGYKITQTIKNTGMYEFYKKKGKKPLKKLLLFS